MTTTHPRSQVHPAGRARRAVPAGVRIAYAGAAVALLGAALLVGGASWALLVALLAPDLPLLAGFDRDGEPGRLAPRAVPAYNATHSLLGPVALLVGAAAAGITTATVVALAWAAHVCVDRAAGYGLRASDGWQR